MLGICVIETMLMGWSTELDGQKIWLDLSLSRI